MEKDLFKFVVAEYEQKYHIKNYLKWDTEENWMPIKKELNRSAAIYYLSKVVLEREADALQHKKLTIERELNTPNTDEKIKALKWAKISNKLLINNNLSESKSNKDVPAFRNKLILSRGEEEREIEKGICFALTCKWLKNFDYKHADEREGAIASASSRMSQLYFPITGEAGQISGRELAARISDFTNAVDTQRCSYSLFLNLAKNNKAKAGTPNSHLGIVRDILISHKFDFTENYKKGFDPKNFAVPYKPSPPLDIIINDLDSIDGCFMLFIQFNQTVGGSAHATCGSHRFKNHFLYTTGTLLFFDPNFGEFFVKRSQRKEFFDALSNNYAMIGQNIHGYHLVPLTRIP